MSGGALEFLGVSRRYGSVTAVDDISFSVQAGTLTTILGPSGCGKTTTLRMIAGLELPSAGRILIGGEDVTRLSAAERNVSMVFQSYALFPHMSVLRNVAYGLLASGQSRSEADRLARAKLELVGLAGLEERLPSALSGGQQQRVAVARALVLEPTILLFDEPLSNLDARLRRKVRDDIRALQQDLALTVVYVTHDQSEALAVSDTVIVMNRGKIAQMGPARAIYEQPADAFVADFMGEANLFEGTLSRSDAGWAFSRHGATIALGDRPDLTERPATLAIRPYAVEMGMASEAGLPGKVVRATYVGDWREFEIETAWGPINAMSATDAFAAGDPVSLSFRNDRVMILA
ncbi:ABC transporter ATP-binding protein [Bosea sp. (in: a-proteobacteria)]|jgi:iron(III) transport system ATP-binding protein|uniref:ABC transporter ATP-binding protein n=1 Tax=Bosea sp. (in: a-proteobacteria) TaxID=1871050 RepID=UPI00273419C7|nr:ABC transporter ATP-binding protein [Bosea sp. (in: a-proteobacteria)]MDP3409165.1 ABC transporter ATP-binding protein [Bosea sp. (in: a-proteobacteria)]